MAIHSQSELHSISQLTLDELYIRLFTTSEEGEGFLGSPGIKRRKGQDLFNRSRQKIKHVVCNEWKACQKVEVFDDTINLIDAIAKVVAPQVPQLSALTVAAIVVKIGLRAFCACE
jgi:hypothetical protein